MDLFYLIIIQYRWKVKAILSLSFMLYFVLVVYLLWSVSIGQ